MARANFARWRASSAQDSMISMFSSITRIPLDRKSSSRPFAQPGEKLSPASVPRCHRTVASTLSACWGIESRSDSGRLTAPLSDMRAPEPDRSNITQETDLPPNCSAPNLNTGTRGSRCARDGREAGRTSGAGLLCPCAASFSSLVSSFVFDITPLGHDDSVG